ncbi:peptidoglycan/LPS O-acetylase OafA/YrhL [Spinactinospora alkalitolerans]|uniref:Peptidoglycan/LPS O-acetylase OafA/YrhL n=1 Tax=Spinactinospora alkalitolerans TaxID=687207 RepID=A0A852TX37_9ACTN|nr:acyltransferase family protein [Spinactinospora alkalitolerans]NYE47462.1 peptidoglycan/LPS O-acetylase OafA/YrhL [Spinactinospora alkalitolerans]
MTTETAPAAAPATRAPADGRRFYPEVQGLRAVAVLLVVVYHIDADLIPGGYVGVDVFFVISGFLITTMLIREVHREGRVSLAGFYVRRIRRILPAATLVLAVTGVCAYLLLPLTRLEDTALQLIASAAYAENLYLAHQAVDYLAAEAAETPVQHFWSLAVEEQFYLVWPLLFIGWAWMRPRVRRGGDLILGATLLVAAASFACSVWLTATEPAQAYFLPQTRMWELAVGGVLALALARWGLPERVRWPLGWAGLAAIAAAAWGYDSATAFPGYTAALPVLGAAAVIAAGQGRWSAGDALACAPARFVGDISYALYLWHWPVIVFTVSVSERELTPVTGLLVLMLSVLLSWGTKITVEDPVRRAAALRTFKPALAFAVAAILVVAVIGGGHLANLQRLRTVDFDPAVHQGPSALAEPVPTALTEPVYPSPLEAEDDLPDVYSDGCQASNDDTEPRHCVYGPDDAAVEVAIVGDSHAAHWVPALQEVAERHGWRLHTYTKASCAFTDTLITVPEGAPYLQCREWNEGVMRELESLGPDMVFTSSSVNAKAAEAESREEGDERITEGMTRLWDELSDSGSRVVVIRDSPRTKSQITECVLRHTDDLSACTRAREDALSREDPQVEAAQRTEARTDVLDLTDRFCAGPDCPAVIGNVLVYRDSHHITATYSRLLASDLDDRLHEVL